ncbi:MAG: TIGR02996 domain-containing protein [Planctomycetes bacterium]|nr:TIGR02996 domain-containing protein [Planctomycetota bacterium]
MADENDFLAAIVDRPDDDALRLVFADWLDEHGQPDRAAFIRLQIRAATLPPGDPERAALSGRAEELKRPHLREWMADFPWGGRLTGFDRGLLACVHGTAAQIAALPKRVWQAHPIRHLVLDKFAGRLDRVLALPSLPRVRHLTLFASDGPPTAADLEALATCALLTGLESFANLADCGNGLAAALARCPSARGLTDLYLSDGTHDDEGTAALCTGADNLRRLKRLRIDGRAIGPGTAAALARTPALAALESLQLYLGPTGDEGAAALAGAPHLAGLRELNLLAQGIGPAGAAALAATPHLTRLVRFSLSGNRTLGAGGAGAIAGGPWAELTTLELDACLLFDNAAEAMARSGRLVALVALDLERNEIGPAGAAALSRAGWLAGLRELNLKNNPIGAVGARALRDGLPNLQTLRVSA